MNKIRKSRWFLKGQALFRSWKRKNDLIGSCSKQVITPYGLEETWTLRLRKGGSYVQYTLYAHKNTTLVYVTDHMAERIVLMPDTL